MKTLITLSSILAAGTLAANAETLEDNILLMYGNTLKATTSLTSSGSFSYTFAFSDEGISRLTGPIGKAPGVDYGSAFISLSGANSGQNFVVAQGYSSSEGKITISGIYLATGDSVNSGSVCTGYRTGAGTENIPLDAVTYGLGDGVSVENVSGTLTYSYSEGTKLYMYFEYSDGTHTDLKISDTGLKWSNFSNWSNLKVNTTLLSSVALFDSSLSETDAKAVNRTILTVPEPSAFGILAGIGALALAGTRRRRKVK